MVWRQRTEAFLNEEQLIQLVLSWKHGISVNQFSENATDRPHVNLLAVSGAHEQLRRTVPPSSYIVSEFLF